MVTKKSSRASRARYSTDFERGTRSYVMSQIRSKDTSPERLVRSFLFAQGLRFRKNDKRYPGHPDVVLPKYHTMIFVNGCFWHLHEGCSKARIPKSSVEFWTAKLLRNRARDAAQHEELAAAGWRVLVVWECELAKDRRDETLANLLAELTAADCG
jgi:DNA mismatch endonuclease (patch repair protein)